MRPARQAARLVLLCLFFVSSAFVLAATKTKHVDPLPSWNDGPTKTAILDFVARVTKEGGPDFVPETSRIAVFTADGVLWPERPLIEGLFVRDRLETLAQKDPSIRDQQPFKDALEKNLAFFKDADIDTISQMLARTHGNMTEGAFAEDARRFFRTTVHPDLGVPVMDLSYLPMVELLNYLRANHFETWICSGESVDFMRVVSRPLFGVPPEQVIGSTPKLKYYDDNGLGTIWRLPEAGPLNDGEAKPVNISLQIGQRPLIAVGDVRSGGDIPMLTYSTGRQSLSFQLVINHDDDQREFAYKEPDSATLDAASLRGWNVVSMRRDWKRIFAVDAPPPRH